MQSFRYVTTDASVRVVFERLTCVRSKLSGDVNPSITSEEFVNTGPSGIQGCVWTKDL